MKKIEKYEAMLSLKLLDSMPVLFKNDSEKASYYTLPLYGDFTGFPPCFVFSGTHDIFYPQIPPFVQLLKNAGVTTEFIIGEGMMHVWPYMPVAPECKKALAQIIGVIKR
jgi:acetyl esterase/lipase